MKADHIIIIVLLFLILMSNTHFGVTIWTKIVNLYKAVMHAIKRMIVK